jgi:hypothetical protein
MKVAWLHSKDPYARSCRRHGSRTRRRCSVMSTRVRLVALCVAGVVAGVVSCPPSRTHHRNERALARGWRRSEPIPLGRPEGPTVPSHALQVAGKDAPWFPRHSSQRERSIRVLSSTCQPPGYAASLAVGALIASNPFPLRFACRRYPQCHRCTVPSMSTGRRWCAAGERDSGYRAPCGTAPLCR